MIRFSSLLAYNVLTVSIHLYYHNYFIQARTIPMIYFFLSLKKQETAKQTLTTKNVYILTGTFRTPAVSPYL